MSKIDAPVFRTVEGHDGRAAKLQVIECHGRGNEYRKYAWNDGLYGVRRVRGYHQSFTFTVVFCPLLTKQQVLTVKSNVVEAESVFSFSVFVAFVSQDRDQYTVTTPFCNNNILILYSDYHNY